MSSRRANPKLIGGFVIAGIGLVVAATLIFGSFTFFQPTDQFVVFFQGTVDGLNSRFACLIPRRAARPRSRKLGSAMTPPTSHSKYRS